MIKRHFLPFGINLRYMSCTTSTNDIALHYLEGKKSNPPSFLTFFTHHQTKGRGRRGNKWLGSQAHFYASFVWSQEQPLPHFTSIALASHLSYYLNDAYGISTRVKWPNDIYVSNKKLAGVLIESQKINHQNYYVLGLGINLSKDASLDNKMITLEDLNVNLENFSSHCIAQVWHCIQCISRQDQDWQKKFQENDMLKHHKIQFQAENKIHIANYIGVNSEGALLVKEAGVQRSFVDATEIRIIFDEHML